MPDEPSRAATLGEIMRRRDALVMTMENDQKGH